MTWSVSASGPKADVARRITEQVTGHPLVTHALVMLVEDQFGQNVSISGSGSGTSLSVSVSSYTPPVSAG
jgi:hypothetical protein